MRLYFSLLLASVAGALCTATRVAAAEPPLERRFTEVVHPFLKTYCFHCHGPSKPRGKLNLSAYTSVDAIAKAEAVWERVNERLESEAMPPENAPRLPTAHERRAVLDWLGELREQQAQRNAGDPGRVPARRLSNAELDYTIRDLTAVDIRPTREFPVDPANEAGFDNSGESLTLSPILLKKYLDAARGVASHLLLTPSGFAFAPYPVITDTDRDRYCVARIIAFYDRHRVDYADYFLTAWRYKHRAALGKPSASLAHFAKEAGLSRRYLAAIWSVLKETPARSGPLVEVQTQWRGLPTDFTKKDDARRDCERLRDRVIRQRRSYTPSVGELRAKGISRGSQPFIVWRDAQIAAQHRRALQPASPEEASFCSVFPDAFVVSERAVYYDPSTSARGRLLSAGFHLMQGYYRDDGPLSELVLDEAERGELDSLWEELHFITQDATRQYKDFVFFERAEPPRFMYDAAFDFARSEDADVTSPTKIERLREAYLAKARRLGAGKEALAAMESYFADMSRQIRHFEEARHVAEPRQLAALAAFAARAYRRPLTPVEREDLPAFYHKLREQNQLSHEEAVRDSVVSILVSPEFWYRVDLPEAGKVTHPLPDYALASRLSYFLWSSMPDDELLTHAAAGDLHRPEVLIRQTRRMLDDGRVRGLVEQFAGNWLDFRRFDETNTVDRNRFPSFTNALRQAMADEPVHFFEYVVRQNRPVVDLLDANYTFVNSTLAEHYGMSIPKLGDNEWIKVDDAHRYGRGGLPPMAVFLTRNSPGLRTSPVKRGYWVVRRVLGEHIPPPPPVVPELPKDEAKLGALTLPQLLARHRADRACAGCHQRFVALGLAFEGFGPIGERRTVDLGGHSIESTATYPDGSVGTGLDGLRRYVLERRREDFVENLCRKSLAYALGRSLTLSDKPIIDKMRARLADEGYRFGSLIDSIVTSPQFLNHRGRDDVRE
jgi:hypothetical protein